MKTKIPYRRLCVGALIAAFLTAACPVPRRAEGSQEYLKAVTYVSDAWVSNFWNSESDHMDEELAQIAADGFNCIILVVPWREFEPTMEPISFNRYAFDKLNKVMKAAQAHGLMVELRVGYTWDYYADDESALRFRELLRSKKCREAWLSYADKLYQQVSVYPNFHGGFITWEDFWNYVEDADHFGDGWYSRNEAKVIGYQAYLKERYTLEELTEWYHPSEPFGSYEDIYIPRRSSYAYKLFYEFYDDYLMGILKDTQAVFPNLSMEVRLDVDPVDNQEGTGKMGVPHYQTFGCGDSDYTSLMYSVSMGYGPHNMISAQQAIETMNQQLSIVKSHNGGKPVFIDQLLYMDMTEGFESNARLLESERGAFLIGIAPTLRAYTNGYAVWSYRNYANNPLYNSQFALGVRGWEVSGGTTVERNGSRQMKLYGGGAIAQKVGHRISGRSTHESHVRFTADSNEPVNLTVKLGRTEKTVQVDGSQQFDLNFGKIDFYEVSFQTDGEVYLDNIQMYNFVQDGQLRDMEGNELSCMEAVRSLNAVMN